ncbi:MAG: hypothetical protein H0X70_10720 [Segetibacter sp.]|nr:hypothetical protein [Segetibacter sp.]
MIKKIKLCAAAVFFIFVLSLKASAQDVIKKKGYTLTFESNYAELNPALKQRLIETFFKVYPELSKEYNKKAIVKKLDAQMRDHTYTEQTRKDLIEKTLDEPWADYTKN